MAYSTKIKKPGYMGRACIVWLILNIIMAITIIAMMWFLSTYTPDILKQWLVMAFVVGAAVVSEWVIMWQTIAPVCLEWITQEEDVKEGQQPSWAPKTPTA